MQNGKEHGFYKKFYPDGSLKVVSIFQNGVKHGKTIIYYNNGSILSRVIYNGDKEVYSVDYTKQGSIEYSFLPLNIYPKFNQNTVEVSISLKESFLEEPLLGVIVGKLNTYNVLEDTLLREDNYGRRVKFQLKNFKEPITGILYEIDPNNYDIINQTPFYISKDNVSNSDKDHLPL